MADSNLIKNPTQLLEDILRTYRSSLIINGHSINPNVGPGSDIYNLTLGVSNELGVALSNVVNSANNLMPDTATGSNLDRILNQYGLVRRPAAPFTGYIVFITVSVSSVFIATGSRLTDDNGVIYIATSGGNYNNNDLVYVQSQDVNVQTVPERLTWIDTPPFSQSQVTVVDGVAGTDVESDSNAKARLLSVLQNPPQFGNWSDLANLIDGFLPAVIEKSFIYPCADGPATQHIAITAPLDMSKPVAERRVVSDIYVDQANSYAVGNSPSSTNTVLTTVEPVLFNLIIGLNIPYPIGAQNNGFGGGWVNFNPWPLDTTFVLDGTINGKYVDVSVVSGSSLPQAGITKITYAYDVGRYLKTDIIVAVTQLTSTTLRLQLSENFIGDGDTYIMPTSVNIQAYYDNVISYFAKLGPGQKTNIPSLLPRALRQPLTNSNFPDQIDSRLLKNLEVAFNEITDNSFLFRTSTTTPAIPTDINDPPKIFVPNAIAFLPI